MRNLGVIGAVAAAGLLSQGVLALPMSPRAMYPYPIYKSDDFVPFASAIPPNTANRQGCLEMISAVFSQAVDVGFVTAMLRPQEHLVPFFRYYNPMKRVALSHTVSSGHSKRALRGINPEPADGNTTSMSKNALLPRENSDDPKVFRPHDYRRSKNDVGGDRGVMRDYRRSLSVRFSPAHNHGERSAEAARSSTHSISGEHLRERKVDEHPPRQPPVHHSE